MGTVDLGRKSSRLQIGFILFLCIFTQSGSFAIDEDIPKCAERELSFFDRAKRVATDAGHIVTGAVQRARVLTLETSSLDLGDLKTLINGGVIKMESIRLVKGGHKAPPDFGPNHVLLKKGNRTYFAESVTGAGGEPIPFPASSPFEMIRCVSWARIYQDTSTKEALARAQDAIKTLNHSARASSYRSDAVLKPLEPLALVMPMGHVFYRVDEPEFRDLGVAWYDPQFNKTWMPEIAGRVNHQQAKDKCVARGKNYSLPSETDFRNWVEQLGTSSGRLNNIFPDATKWYWSSSIHPDDSNKAFDFFGGSGHFGNHNRSNYDNAVRCVRSR